MSTSNDEGSRDTAVSRTRLDGGPSRVASRHAVPDALAARHRCVTLADVVVERGIQTGPFGSQLHASDYTASGVGVVMPQDIGDNEIVQTNMARISNDMAHTLGRHTLRVGDIVYSRRGDVTKRAFVGESDGEIICGTGCLRVRLDSDQADSRFVAYALGLPEIREWITRHAVGATMANLNTKILGSVPLELPHLVEQKAIAEVLGALDDKIAANRRVMETADDLLRMQVKKLWQTDEVAKLGEVLKLQYGKSLPMTLRQDGEVSVVGSGGVVGMHNSSLIEGPCVVVGRKGTVGATYWIDGPAFPIDTTYWVEPLGVPLIYAYYLLESIDFASMSTDSAVPGLNRERAYAIKVPAPTPSLTDAFAENNADLLALRAASTRENQALAAARDELLPLLMSGKISVKDAEGQIDDATAH